MKSSQKDGTVICYKPEKMTFLEERQKIVQEAYMKILFVYSIDEIESISKPLRNSSGMQFGISYISSAIKAHGHQSRLLVLGSNNNWKYSVTNLIETYMADFAPHLICFTAVTSQFPFIVKIATYVKSRWANVFLIIGGVHATLNPNEVINNPFDAICIGEGEYPLVELCDQIGTRHQPHGIANLWIKSADGTIEKNPTRPFLEDIDNLPFPDREMWLPWTREQTGSGLTILLGRGCPYGCTYCCNHALRKVASGKYVRMRSPENIIQEIALLHETYPAQRQIYFEVESIALNKTWLFELCSQLEAFNRTINDAKSYSCNFRISRQSVEESIFIALKKANFSGINIGLESGSERIRREILKRDYSNRDFLHTVAMARKYKLKIGVFNMIGLPGETYDDHLETIRLNVECQPDVHFTQIFFPYPGTELYEYCLKKGFIKDQIDPRLERRQSVLDFPEFNRAQIQRAYIWFNYHIYSGHKPLWWILIQVFRVRIRSSVIANLLFRKLSQLPILGHVRAKLFNG